MASGCTYAPGSHIETSEKKSVNNGLSLDQVNIQAITPELIQTLSNTKKIKSHNLINDIPNNITEEEKFEYRLGVGDVLNITVWGHPELTESISTYTKGLNGLKVQADGTINFAYAPKVIAAGKTLLQLQEALSSRLRRVIEEPLIDIKVIDYKSQKAYVTGAVNSPGVYPITHTPMTLIDAIIKAGGLTEQADWESVIFTRNNKTEVVNLSSFYLLGDLSANRLLKDGDFVHVKANHKRNVYMLGNVVRAGKVSVGRYGLNLAEALADVGGINERTANANGIFVIRKRTSSDEVIADVYKLNASDVISLTLAEQFELHPDDIVYVTSAPLSRWNKVISLLLPSLLVSK